MSSEKLKPVLIALKIWEIEHHAFVVICCFPLQSVTSQS